MLSPLKRVMHGLRFDMYLAGGSCMGSPRSTSRRCRTTSEKSWSA